MMFWNFSLAELVFTRYQDTWRYGTQGKYTLTNSEHIRVRLETGVTLREKGAMLGENGDALYLGLNKTYNSIVAHIL